jgi:hypothetical protein
MKSLDVESKSLDLEEKSKDLEEKSLEKTILWKGERAFLSKGKVFFYPNCVKKYRFRGKRVS